MKSPKEQNDDCTLDEDMQKDSKILELLPRSPLTSEKEVVKSDYILHVTGTPNSTPDIALGLSNYEVRLFSLSMTDLVPLTTISEHEDSIIGLKFAENDYNMLYSGSADGTIKLWDIRTNRATLTFCDTSAEDQKDKKMFSCFDVSPNCRLLAAGTDRLATDAYILFWDVRNSKLMGGYWESHSDDITQVKFNPDDSNILMSGSTDGLINLYDLKQTSEDEALTDSFCTESTVDVLNWYKKGNKNFMTCITHTHELQVWKVDDASPTYSFKRNQIANSVMGTPEYVYLVNTHVNAKNEPFLLVCSDDNGEHSARGLHINNELKLAFNLDDNKQMIRSSWCHNRLNLLVAGGEKGILGCWQLSFAE